MIEKKSNDVLQYFRTFKELDLLYWQSAIKRSVGGKSWMIEKKSNDVLQYCRTFEELDLLYWLSAKRSVGGKSWMIKKQWRFTIFLPVLLFNHTHQELLQNLTLCF